MKRFAVILVFIFLLCGCSRNAESEFCIHKYFSSKVYVSTGQINFSGDMSYRQNGVLRLKIKAPDEVSGYTYTVRQNRVTMSYEGLEYKCRTTELPTYAPVAVINTVLSETELSPPIPKAGSDGLKAKVEGFSVGFTQSGYIESISSGDLHITFIKQK